MSRKPTLCSPSGAHTLLEVPSHCRQGKRTHLALEGADDFSSFFYHHPPGLPGWCHHPQQTPVAPSLENKVHIT